MFDPIDFEDYLTAIAGIESSGWENPYEAIGGDHNHYDGKYQMGRDAKIEAGRILGIELLHTPEARKAFRNNPELQERAMQAFTQANHRALISKQGKNYTSLDPQEQLAHLGYAHNQGAGGASKWMRSDYKDVGEDAFETKGTRYSSAVRGALGIAGPSDYMSLAYHGGKNTLKDIRDVAMSSYDWVEKSTPAVMETLDNAYESATSGVRDLFGVVYPNSNPEFDEIGPERFAYHIARDNNMTLDELQSLNPEQEITYGSQGTRMPAGLKLRVGGFEKLS